MLRLDILPSRPILKYLSDLTGAVWVVLPSTRTLWFLEQRKVTIHLVRWYHSTTFCTVVSHDSLSLQNFMFRYFSTFTVISLFIWLCKRNANVDNFPHEYNLLSNSICIERILMTFVYAFFFFRVGSWMELFEVSKRSSKSFLSLIFK